MVANLGSFWGVVVWAANYTFREGCQWDRWYTRVLREGLDLNIDVRIMKEQRENVSKSEQEKLMFRNLKNGGYNKICWEEATNEIESSECDGLMVRIWGSSLVIYIYIYFLFGEIKSKVSTEKEKKEDALQAWGQKRGYEIITEG